MTATETRPTKSVPAGITFGRKVLQLPQTSEVFDRALWIQRCLPNPVTVNEIGGYGWIQRGDPIAEVTVLLPATGIGLIDFFSTKSETVTIRSPTSGLLLHATHSFGGPDWGIAHTALLLPDDEPPPADGDFMFGALCGLCWDYRQHIYYKPKEFNGRFNDTNLRQAFDEQRARRCRTVDALPDYREYLEEARTKKPGLRPLLKHLL